MKEYTVKYESYNGGVITKKIVGYDKLSAIESLTNVKEIYWIKLSSEVTTSNNIL